MSETPTTADRLLDAQVAWLLTQLQGERLVELLADDVDDLLAIGAELPVRALAEPDAVKGVLRLALERVPASAAASTVVEVAATAVHEGPTEPFAATDLVSREHVEALLTEALARTELVEAVLDHVAESPLAAGLAARFVTRIVGDVLATNRAVAEKIPGVGSLVSLGTSVTGRVAGVADKQLQAVLGDTAGKGATFAMRRLNRLIVDTLKDPATLAAAMEVFDLYAEQPLDSLASEERLGTLEDVQRVAGLLQDVAIGAAPAAPVLTLVDRLVDGFFAVYGEEPAATLVDDLGLTRDDLVEQARRVVPGLLERAIATGHVERVLRERLAPFYATPEVAAILGD